MGSTETVQNELRQEALLLRKRVIEYYQLRGAQEPEIGLARLLKHIADKLGEKPMNEVWMRNNIFGIARIVSDDFCLEESELGKDLLEFYDKVNALLRK